MITLDGLTTEETKDILPDHTILLGYVGSISHGTRIPNHIDDKDIMGVCVADAKVYYGLDNFEQKSKQYNEWDSVVYEIKKYIRLLAKGNPNVISLLWLRPQDYLHITPAGQKIIDNRDLFISKNIYHSFTGYAYGQLHKMEHHAFNGYMGEKRKKLVEKFGYDCKNASHLIRLLRMGIELLETGELHVFREHDADELMCIKTGGWSLEEVKEESQKLFTQAKKVFDESLLPSCVDYEKINDLLISILKSELQ